MKGMHCSVWVYQDCYLTLMPCLHKENGFKFRQCAHSLNPYSTIVWSSCSGALCWYVPTSSGMILSHSCIDCAQGSECLSQSSERSAGIPALLGQLTIVRCACQIYCSHYSWRALPAGQNVKELTAELNANSPLQSFTNLLQSMLTSKQRLNISLSAWKWNSP